MKKYKAFPGFIGYMILLPSLLPLLVGLLVMIRMWVTGEVNKTIFVYVLIGGLSSILLFLWEWDIITHTVLIFEEWGMTCKTIKFHSWNSFKLKPFERIEIQSPWSAIREVKWVGAPKAQILVKTDYGDIKFWVIFHPRVNAEIMQEILRRVPHLSIEERTPVASMMKEYKAYPSFIAYLILLPWVLFNAIVLWKLMVKFSVTGKVDKIILGYLGISDIIITLPLFVLLAILTLTSLTIHDEGITYKAIQLHHWNIFRARPFEIKSPWNAIQEIRWGGIPKMPILIKTDHGDIKFRAVLRPRVNEEIMQEILKRAPHLSR